MGKVATGAVSEREAVERVMKSYLAQYRKPRARKNMFDLVGVVRLRDDYDDKGLRAVASCGDSIHGGAVRRGCLHG
jgi:hypothetical protein